MESDEDCHYFFDYVPMYENESDDEYEYRKKADKRFDEEIAVDEYRKRSRNLSVFDAIDPPQIEGLLSCVGALHITDDLRFHLIPLCKLALKDYNQKNQGANFVFDELEKCTQAIGTYDGDMYYIAFQAKEEEDPSNSPATTFQAKVLWEELAGPGPKLISCAMKPT